MFDFKKFQMFAAINDAEQEEQEKIQRQEEERLREEERLLEKEKCEQELNRWEESQKKEKENREREWNRREREQIEWQMKNADLYGYDKEELQKKLDDLEEG